MTNLDTLSKIQDSDCLKKITSIHTLGPSGTNCELAAHEWLSRQNQNGEIYLYPTLEVAAKAVFNNDGAALLGCVVYPDLHKLVFSNLEKFKLVDCFIMPTYSMVLATRGDKQIDHSSIIATHPAPCNLAEHVSSKVRLVNSNSQAAIVCSSGETDACITTIVAAERNSLKIIKDYGPVPMGFTIHANLKSNPSMEANYAGATC